MNTSMTQDILLICNTVFETENNNMATDKYSYLSFHFMAITDKQLKATEIYEAFLSVPENYPTKTNKT